MSPMIHATIRVYGFIFSSLIYPLHLIVAPAITSEHRRKSHRKVNDWTSVLSGVATLEAPYLWIKSL